MAEADFQSYMESTNERLQADLQGPSHVPQVPMMPPDMRDPGQLGASAWFDPSSGYSSEVSTFERLQAQSIAANRYYETSLRQSRRDLGLDAIKTGASLLVGSKLGFLGMMGTDFLFDQGYNLFGLKDPLEVYGKDDWVRSQMAGSIDANSNMFMSSFQFGQRGLTMDQSSELARQLMPSMREQGFQGLEIERMMPALASSGALNLSGSFSTADEAVEALASKLENLTGRIAEAVKKSSLSIEEATQFVVQEHKLSGGAAIASNDNTLFSSMNLASNATGMSYNDSMQFMTGTMGAWAGTSGNLIPFMESAAVGAAAGQVAYMNSPWSAAWDRAGGVAAVAGGYASAGNAYWMQQRQITRLGQMYAGGAMTDEAMYDLAEGGKFSDLNLDSISNVNDRYEAEFYGRQALARNPIAAQAAAFGDTVRQMDSAGADSRIARAGWLMRHRNMSESQALAYLDQHYAVSTESGRFGAYTGGLRSNIQTQRDDIGEAWEQAWSDIGYLSGEKDQYWTSHIMGLYEGAAGENIAAGGYLDYIREDLAENATLLGTRGTSGFFGRRGSTSIMDESERRNLTGAGTAFEAQLAARGLGYEGLGGDAVLGALGRMEFRDIEKLKINRGGGRQDTRLVDEISRAMGNSLRGDIGQYLSWWKVDGALSGAREFVRSDGWGEGDFDAFLALSLAEQDDILRGIDIGGGATAYDAVYGTGDSGTHLYTENEAAQEGFQGALSGFMMTPEMEAKAMRGMSVSQANAVDSIYGVTQRDQAVRGAMVSLIESGDAASIFGGFDSKGSLERRSGLDRMTGTLAALERVSGNPGTTVVNAGTRDAYQRFNTKLSEDGYTINDATTGLEPSSSDSHMTIRDRLAENGYGSTWAELDSGQKDIIDAYIYDNEVVGPEGERQWGGRQGGVIQTLRKDIGEAAEGIITANQAAIASEGGDRFMKRVVGLIHDRYSSISTADASAYASAQLALNTGNREEYDSIIAQFTDTQLEELGRLDDELGVYGGGLSRAEQLGAMAYASYDNVMSGIVSASGIEGEQAQANFRAALEDQDTEALAGFGYGGEHKNLYEKYARGDIDLMELAEKIGADLPEGAYEDYRQGQQLQDVAENMARGISTVRMDPDSPPMTITSGEGSISVTFVDGEENS